MDKQFYIYLAIMSLITYAIRAIPLVFINKKITNYRSLFTEIIDAFYISLRSS